MKEFIIITVIIIVIVFVVREIVTWYWKIDQIIILLKEISKKLNKS